MQVVDRCLAALVILSKEGDGLSVSELSEKLDLAPSSTHRVLASLKDNHFVVQDEESKKYRIGYKLFTLCAGISGNNSLLVTARPVMKALSKEIDKTIVLCVMEQDHIINVDCIERGDSSMYMVKTGRQMPLYSTSAGRVFSAYMNRDRVFRLYNRTERTASTPYTKTELDDLCRELDQIRTQGYALIDEELQLGIQGVACPVFDTNGKVTAALAFTCMKQPGGMESDMIEKLKQAAQTISNEII